MKKAVWTVTAFVAAALIVYSDAAAQGIKQALGLCAQVLIPSVFPFMSITCIAGAAGRINAESKAAKLFEKNFHCPADTAGVWMLSMLGGYPVGASMSAQLLDKGCITPAQSRTVTLVCFNAGPAFVINALGREMLGSERAGAIIFAGVCVGAAVSGIAAGRIFKSGLHTQALCVGQRISISQALVEGVYTAGKNMLGICAWMLFFSAAVSLMLLLPVSGRILDTAVMLLEITGGCARCAQRISLPLLAAFVSFGGVCVLCQIASVAKQSTLKIWELLVTRLFSALISCAATKLLLEIFPAEIAVNANASFECASPYYHSAPSAVMLMILCAIFVFDLDRKQKV